MKKIGQVELSDPFNLPIDKYGDSVPFVRFEDLPVDHKADYERHHFGQTHQFMRTAYASDYERCARRRGK